MRAVLAGAALLAALVTAAPAGAEPGVGDIVCQQSKLGATPDQIADALYRGDPRWSRWDTGRTVWSDLQDCG